MNKSKSTRPERAARNSRIVADYLAGLTQQAIADKNGLTVQYVGHIIRQSGLSAADRGTMKHHRESRSVAHLHEEIEAGLLSQTRASLESSRGALVEQAHKRFEVNAWGVIAFFVFVGMVAVALG